MRHKARLSNAADYDIFSVAAQTSEIKLYKIDKKYDGKVSMNKLMTLGGHSKEIVYVHFDKDICGSISKDLTVIVHKMNFDKLKGEILYQKQQPL